MSDFNPKLVTDLARLAARYDPEDWERLLAALENDESRARLRNLLADLAAVSRTRPKRPLGTTAAQVRSILAAIQAEDPDHAELLNSIWLKLRSRELLPTMAAVRAFGDAMGAKPFQASKREQAVNELMEKLAKLPGEALEQRMRETIVADRRLGEEYEQWVQLILGRPRAVESPHEPSASEKTSAPPTD
jgi:hypothetical protein